MPRFVRDLSENGKEILSMNEVIAYLVKSYQPIVDEMDLMQVCNIRVRHDLKFDLKMKMIFDP